MSDIESKLPINIKEFEDAAISASNPIAIEVAVSSSIVDPRDVRALTDADVVSVEGGNTSEVTIDITKVLGTAISATNGVIIQLTDGTAVYDARDIRALTDDDVVSVEGGNTSEVVIDLNLIAGAAISATNPIFSELTDGTNPISSTNPLPVNIVEKLEGTAVHSYNSATVVKDSSQNHDYAITNTKTIQVKKIVVGASGSGKYTVQHGLPAGLATKAVVFTSAATKSFELEFNPPLSQASTGTEIIRIIKYNDDNADQDMFSTIMGEEI